MKNEMLESIYAIEGMLTKLECQKLYELAFEAKIGCIVEIGSYRGLSTICLAKGTAAGANLPVYAIEPHEEFNGVKGGHFGPADRAAFMRNVLNHNVAEAIRLINLGSEKVFRNWSMEIGLLLIDGDHRDEPVALDFQGWTPHLITGGVVALHDSTDATLGPKKVVDKAIESEAFKLVEIVDLLTVLKKIR